MEFERKESVLARKNAEIVTLSGFTLVYDSISKENEIRRKVTSLRYKWEIINTNQCQDFLQKIMAGEGYEVLSLAYPRDRMDSQYRELPF